MEAVSAPRSLLTGRPQIASRVGLIDLRWFRESGRFVRNKGDDGIAEILLSKL